MKLMKELSPYLASARNVVTNFCVLVICVLSFTLVTRFAGSIIFRFLKTSAKYHVHRIYVTSSQRVAMEVLPRSHCLSNQTTDEEQEPNTVEEDDSERMPVRHTLSCSNASAEENDEADFSDFVETKV